MNGYICYSLLRPLTAFLWTFWWMFLGLSVECIPSGPGRYICRALSGKATLLSTGGVAICTSTVIHKNARSTPPKLVNACGFFFPIYLILLILIPCLKTCSASLRNIVSFPPSPLQTCIKHTLKKKKKRRKSPLELSLGTEHSCTMA